MLQILYCQLSRRMRYYSMLKIQNFTWFKHSNELKKNNKTDRNWCNVRAHSPSHQVVKQFTTDCIEQQTRGSSDQLEPQPKQTARCYDSLIIHYKTQEEKKSSSNNNNSSTKAVLVRMGRQSRTGRERLRAQNSENSIERREEEKKKNKPMGIIQRADSTHLQLADFIMAVRICSG